MSLEQMVTLGEIEWLTGRPMTDEPLGSPGDFMRGMHVAEALTKAGEAWTSHCGEPFPTALLELGRIALAAEQEKARDPKSFDRGITCWQAMHNAQASNA